MKPILLVVILATFWPFAALADDPAVASKLHVPAIWGAGLGTLPDYSFKKAAARSKQLGRNVLMEQFPAWEGIFKLSHKTDITQAELLSFLLQLDPYWEPGANRAAVLYEHRQKLEYLPLEAARTWQAALSKKMGSTVNRQVVTGFLIQSAQVNPNCKFDEKKSAMMLERLNALPTEAIKSWRDTLKLDSRQAAMSMIESNEFFDNANRFKEELFRKAVETQKAQRKGK
jgi:hypothetical protein